MIKVLKANQYQYDLLNGYQSGCSRIEFVLDGNGSWIVGKEILEDENYQGIISELLSLEEIDFIPAVSVDN